ncbi:MULTISPECIES: OPT family oligopeptide transporter [Candidatus Ichthyocystis]|uniref:Peptide transporter n=1 Tax=Candidatus Ichthyocystis hellenicum TaxID=1561003 RepID=A0A0S4M3M4_9BURK|nr:MULTISPECIES: oligopeptide transporter, OPT family [Ichthyocystis]CUT16902.1 peptide transporter [Candidatus Ichthyocystis hellenicum]
MSEKVPQLTFRSVILGVVLAIIMASANAYLGLFAGQTVAASIPASVISMAVLRLFKNSSTLENNIVQTAASAGEAIAGGAIFTIPALVLMGHWKDFHYWWVVAICGMGGILGVAFSTPLRRILVVEEKLPFPEGLATAEVLKSGDKSGRSVKVLLITSVVGAVSKFCESGLRLWSGAAQISHLFGNYLFFFGLDVSPALMGVGFIIELNICLNIFLGGAFTWLLAIPFYYSHYINGHLGILGLSADASPISIATTIWSQKMRFLGVGGMVVGGIWTVISLVPPIYRGIASSRKIRKDNKDAQVAIPESARDLSMKWVIIAVVLSLIPIFVIYVNIVHSFFVAAVMTVIMVVTGFLFCCVAGYMSGVIGSSNSPVSGVTLSTLLMSSFLLLSLLGPSSKEGPIAAIMIAAVVCCAASIAGDNLQDLKAGYVLGATPWKQQIMISVGALSSVFVIAPVLNLLLHAYGIGSPSLEHTDALPAPQAVLMMSVTTGIFGKGLPWMIIVIGGFIAIVVGIIGIILKKKNSRWSASILAVSVGLYLPLEVCAPTLIGGLINEFLYRRMKKRNIDVSSGIKLGLLVSAGFVTGEALVGILTAIPIVIFGDRNILAVARAPFGGWPGALALVAVGYILWYYSSRAHLYGDDQVAEES